MFFALRRVGLKGFSGPGAPSCAHKYAIGLNAQFSRRLKKSARRQFIAGLSFESIAEG
jgi:hypothetical protein